MKRQLVLLLLVRCACPCQEAQTHAPAKATQVGSGTVAAPSARVDAVMPGAQLARSRRNLFAYHEPPRVIARIAPVVQVITPSPVIAEPPADAEVKPQPPQFPWRYIGAFGPAHDPIAAFARDEEIRTVRPNERIDEQFVLRKIGAESVEIETRGWPRWRIPMGLSASM